ncbi:hypothetical protein [Paenibacillus larvae]|uniref:hypothetical protein n=1 Tax=Paenibacillus larvae TaxID=1464 RepID=UPI0028919878|nr:hypothetical protein [Paenibacillus larvae]MDT2232922.1 hypothetical protein [Paenibacillus larvae]
MVNRCDGRARIGHSRKLCERMRIGELPAQAVSKAQPSVDKGPSSLKGRPEEFTFTEGTLRVGGGGRWGRGVCVRVELRQLDMRVALLELY